MGNPDSQPVKRHGMIGSLFVCPSNKPNKGNMLRCVGKCLSRRDTGHFRNASPVCICSQAFPFLPFLSVLLCPPSTGGSSRRTEAGCCFTWILRTCVLVPHTNKIKSLAFDLMPVLTEHKDEPSV